jgi:hypothetical protein
LFKSVLEKADLAQPLAFAFFAVDFVIGGRCARHLTRIYEGERTGGSLELWCTGAKVGHEEENEVVAAQENGNGKK